MPVIDSKVKRTGDSVRVRAAGFVRRSLNCTPWVMPRKPLVVWKASSDLPDLLGVSMISIGLHT